MSVFVIDLLLVSVIVLVIDSVPPGQRCVAPMLAVHCVTPSSS